MRRPVDEYAVSSTISQLDQGNGSNQPEAANINQNVNDTSPDSDNISSNYLSAAQDSSNHFPDFSTQPINNDTTQDFSTSQDVQDVGPDQNWAAFSQFQGIVRHNSLDASGMQAPFYMATGEVFGGSEVTSFLSFPRSI